jgi:hypothetical protein
VKKVRTRAVDRLRRVSAHARTDLADRSARMHQSAEDRRGTRKRGLLAAGLGFGLLAGMFGLVSANVLAVNFTTQNNTFTVWSNYLAAQQAAGYLDATSKQNGTQVGAAEIGINTASLAGLCAINNESIPIIGNVSLKITAGQRVATSFTGTGIPTPPSGTLTLNANGTINTSTSTGIITANQLYMNATALSGYGNLISGLNLGQNAPDTYTTAAVTPGTGNQAPTTGNFGLYANLLNVAGLSGSTYGLNLAGQITLPQLSISVTTGTQNQTNC